MALHGKNRLEMNLVPSKMFNVPSSRRTVASPLDVATHVDGINVETSTSPMHPFPPIYKAQKDNKRGKIIGTTESATSSTKSDIHAAR